MNKLNLHDIFSTIVISSTFNKNENDVSMINSIIENDNKQSMQ